MERSPFRSFSRPGRMTLLLLACASAVEACGSVLPSGSPLGTASMEGWVEPADYSFTLASSCGERSLIGTFRVTVRNHETLAIRGLDASAIAFPGDASEVPTLAELLQEADDARAGNASSVEVETHPVDGHPVNIAIDWMANAIDDEACYRVTDYVPAVPASE
jgi:hypothetical protein